MNKRNNNFNFMQNNDKNIHKVTLSNATKFFYMI